MLKTPPYQLRNGQVCTKEDPNREMWYSSSGECGYWTDDWSKLLIGVDAIPRCPKCGMVGMQASMASWLAGALKYQSEGHPCYVDFTKNSKEQCKAGRGKTWIQRYEEFVGM